MIRLDRMLSEMGLGSRSQVRNLIKSGKAEVNGVTVRDPSLRIDEEKADVCADGRHIRYERNVYLMLNKPAGFLSATKDGGGRTVLELLPEAYRRMGIYPAGRLDIDTEGFLLLTNDGAFAHGVISPGRHVEKVYFARVRGRLDEEDARAFSEGITLSDGSRCRPAGLSVLLSGEVSEAEVTLHEGMFHQVKRMFLSRGKRVMYLKRVSIGGVALDPALEKGAFRPLLEEERGRLFAACGHLKG